MDKLNDLIAQRLEERQRKLDAIKKMKSRENSSFRILRIPLLMAAASVCVLILTMRPMSSEADLNIAPPYFESFKGAAADSISLYLSEKNYDTALSVVDSLMVVSRQDMQEAASLDDPDQKEYLLSIERDYYSELLWSKIYVCLQNQQYDYARTLAHEYISIQNDQPHLQEAMKIIK